MRREQKKRNAEQEERNAKYEREKKERDAEYERMRKQLDKKISDLGSSIGRIVENMVAGENILTRFQALGYTVDDYTRNHRYKNSKLGIKGEIDLILHDGDVAILVGVKTTLETTDVHWHLAQIEKYRRHVDAVGILWPPTTRFLGAVAGAVIQGDAEQFAHDNGLYVIVQSGEAVEIVPTPEGFQAKEW
jgi:predicted AAA+ superfamily ATPase